MAYLLLLVLLAFRRSSRTSHLRAVRGSLKTPYSVTVIERYSIFIETSLFDLTCEQ